MNTNKKIIINATYAGEKPTGVGIFTKELVKGMLRISPDLFHLCAIDDFSNNFQTQTIVNKNFAPENGTMGHISRILWTQSILAWKYIQTCARLLFSTLPEAPILIKNKVVVVHDIIPAKFPEYQAKMKYYFKYIVPKILRSSTHLVFDSEYTKNEVLNYYNLKNMPCTVIQSGYDKKLFHPREKGYIKKKYGYENYYFYVGDMRPYKNLENAIKSFAKAELKDTVFIIAGQKDKRYFPKLNNLISELHLADSVIFTDYVSQVDLQHFYNDAIALFFPSKYEGFGLPPLEAMASGTPVITTKLTSIPEVCGDAAIYIDPDGIFDMASTLKKLAIDSSLRNSYSQKSLERAALFSWDKTAKEYLNLLQGILNEL